MIFFSFDTLELAWERIKKHATVQKDPENPTYADVFKKSVELMKEDRPELQDQAAYHEAFKKLGEMLRAQAIVSPTAEETIFTPGPVPAQIPTHTQAGPTQSNVTMTFSSGAFQINAEGSDAQELASNISRHLGDSMRAVVEQLDTQVIA